MTDKPIVWTVDKAERFILRSMGNLTPKKIIIKTLMANGMGAKAAEKLYKEAQTDLEPQDNTTLRSSIAYSLSGLLATIEEAIETAAEREDFISHQQLLRLKQKTLHDYATQFTDKNTDTNKEPSETEVILKLTSIFGSREE
jgi:hypothetical protein